MQHISATFQREKLTTGQGKDEIMVAVGQFSLLLESYDHYRSTAPSHVDADKNKVDLLTALFAEF